MSVADILQRMAANAGGAQLRRGAIYGDLVAGAASAPAQFLADRDRARLQQEQRARQQAQDARGVAADKRQADADLRDQRKQFVAHEIIKAYTGGSPNDPTSNNLDAGIAKARELGAEDQIPELKDLHRKEVLDAQPKITQEDPTKDTYSNGVLVRPAAPKAMTPAEQAQRDETTRHNKEQERISALTEGRTEAAQRETERHNRATEAAAAAAAKAANPFGPGGDAVTGDALLKKLSPEQRAQSQALVDGRRTLDARMASTPFGKTIIAGAYAIDPTFDQGNYNARSKARSDLVSPNGTGGKSIGALNTAIQHAGKLSDLIEQLDNYESPLANAVVNPLRTAAGSTKVTNYDTVAPQLAKEIERVWRGAGGTAGEIHDLIETIGHNKGKQQQREALQQFVELAKGKLDSLQQQRDNALGKGGADIPILFNQNQPIIDTIAQRASGTTAPKRIVYDMNGTPVK